MLEGAENFYWGMDRIVGQLQKEATRRVEVPDITIFDAALAQALGSAPLARSSLTRSGRSVSLPAAQCNGVKSANASRASTFAPRPIRILAASTPSLQHACDNGLPYSVV